MQERNPLLHGYLNDVENAFCKIAAVVLFSCITTRMNNKYYP